MTTASPVGNPSNGDFADRFQELADLLQLQGESVYRTLAYERTAETFRTYPTSVAELARRGGLRSLPGVGEALAGKAEEYLATGHIPLLDELQATFPPSLVTLMHLPGVGPKTARRLWEALGVADTQSLRAAAEAGRIRALPGMGPKTEANLLKALQTWEGRSDRELLGHVEPLAETLATRLRALPQVVAADVAGSLRRRRSTVRDIDLVVASEAPDAVMDAFARFPEVATVDERGRTKLAARTYTALGVDLRVVAPASYGNLLQHFTGSAEHNVALRGYAQRLGFKISEYDVEEVATGRSLSFLDEDDVYRLLDLQPIPPELREGRGELEAAMQGTLPRLVRRDDLLGDLHVHSDWSDGRVSLRTMALAARERGLHYLCFSDHSQSLGMTKGLTPERVLEQIQVIRDLDARLEGISLFVGSEVDILADGRLDLPDEILAGLDWVTASIHSGFGQPVAQIMKRLESALDHPAVDVIGHPTGRLLGRREPYDVDIERLVTRAAETGTALEINAAYDRLDLCATHARLATKAGAMLVISSDAHWPEGYDMLHYGVGEARRGWVEPQQLVNTRSLADFRKALDQRRARV